MPTTVMGPEKHFKYLDSARGIAALMVFASHFIARNFESKMNVHWLFLIFNGNDAVSFFFVLSGFVLSYKYIVLREPLDIKKFYVSRLFRLFPAYFIIVVWSILYASRNNLNIYAFKDIFVTNKYGFWEEALLLRFHNRFYYPGWTLTLEMLGSFLMPFYIALALKSKKLIPYFIVVTLIIGNNLLFSYLFLFGVVASANYSGITSSTFEQTKWFKYRYAIIVAAILLFSIRQVDAIFPFGSRYKYLADYAGIDFFTFTALACFVFLVGILHSKKVQRFLEKKVLVFLGKISYGIYLVHVVVINTIYLYAEPLTTQSYYWAKLVAVALLCTFGVVAVATVLHYVVELPFIRIGKRIAAAMKPSLVIRHD